MNQRVTAWGLVAVLAAWICWFLPFKSSVHYAAYFVWEKNISALSEPVPELKVYGEGFLQICLLICVAVGAAIAGVCGNYLLFRTPKFGPGIALVFAALIPFLVTILALTSMSSGLGIAQAFVRDQTNKNADILLDLSMRSVSGDTVSDRKLAASSLYRETGKSITWREEDGESKIFRPDASDIEARELSERTAVYLSSFDEKALAQLRSNKRLTQISIGAFLLATVVAYIAIRSANRCEQGVDPNA